MITKLATIETSSTNPYYNLALEEYLTHAVEPGQCILYLWQNQRTVVIGRNQSALSECRVQQLESDGGCLARRLSGGGAVYHDLGNLNFTFLVRTPDYDQKRQTEVILQAVRALGIEAQRTGRNDLVIDGRKFSGHAYYHSGDESYHHGTIMVDVDPKPLELYLNVSPLKLASKGVASVRSRVCNLVDVDPTISIDRLKSALIDAFELEYGLKAERLDEESLPRDEFDELQARYASSEWRFKKERPLQHSVEAKFDWGLVRLDWTVDDGRIAQIALWSDGMDADSLALVSPALTGCIMLKDELKNALDIGNETIAGDIIELLFESE